MSNERRSPLRVFISYAQEDAAQSARVLALANALRRDGIVAELDQYHQQELIDWPRWCREQLRPERSDWVLLICTPVYKVRVEDPEGTGATVGRGVYWEGAAITNAIYADKGNDRFVPLLLDEAPDAAVPGAVEGYTRFRLRGFGLASGDAGYEGLYRLLTRQPGVAPPEPGPPVALAPWGETGPGAAPPSARAPASAPRSAPITVARPAPAPPPAPPARVVLAWLVPAVLLLGLGLGGYWWWADAEDPELARQLRLGDAAMDTGRYAAALSAYRAALDLDGEDAAARYGEAKALVLADPPPTFDREAAVRSLIALRAEDPADPHLPLMLATLAQVGGDPAGARALYGEALALDRDLPQAWFGLGQLEEAQGRRAQAREDYERALTLAPAQPQYLTNLAGVLLAQGDFKGALARYDGLLAAAPRLLLARIDAGNAARLAGDLQAARAHHEQLLLDLGRSDAFSGPDNDGEWVFDGPGGQVSLQTVDAKRAYGLLTAALTRRLDGDEAGAAQAVGQAAGLGEPARARAVLAADLRRLAEVRPQWRPALDAFRGAAG